MSQINKILVVFWLGKVEQTYKMYVKFEQSIPNTLTDDQNILVHRTVPEIYQYQFGLTTKIRFYNTKINNIREVILSMVGEICQVFVRLNYYFGVVQTPNLVKQLLDLVSAVPKLIPHWSSGYWHRRTAEKFPAEEIVVCFVMGMNTCLEDYCEVAAVIQPIVAQLSEICSSLKIFTTDT